MPNIPDLSQLGKRKASDNLGENRIVFVFPNDHDVNGSKVEVLNVTPEQIAVAVFHLNRVALMLMGQRDSVAMQAEQEAIAVRAQLAQERN
jgi:hypothetical protein